MRLIDTSTFEIRTFVGDDVPPYAILSHTWDREELTLRDVMDGGIKHKEGFRKIELCCAQARKDGFRYAWIDTCCIDKTSSAELSEAINSMYQWYKQSNICYAFLSDIHQGMLDEVDPLIRSRWFTRSWTLQELLAPETVVFYDRDWIQLGTASSLAYRLTQVTGIPVSLFLSKTDLDTHCVANKLSWAASRQATRVEDRAYSLLGLFGINMSLLYGEGNKAFERLQRKIIKSTNDLSIFAWSRPATGLEHEAPEIGWLLAESVEDFGHLGPLVASKFISQEPFNPSVQLKSNSMQLQLPLCPDESYHKDALAFLGYKLAHEEKYLCIRLFAQSARGLYARHQEITFLDKDRACNRKAFKLEQIHLASSKVHIFLRPGRSEERSVGLLPFHMRMPNLYLSVSGNSISGQLQARVRYIVDRETGPPRQLVNKRVPELTYAIVTTDGPNCQKFTDVAVADLTMGLSGTDGAVAVFLPHLEDMRFYIGVVSTIMVVEISLDNIMMIEMSIGMRMSDYGPQVYIREVPHRDCGHIPSIWNLDAPRKHTFDEICADKVEPFIANRSFRIHGSVRPTGCSLPHHLMMKQCGCRSRRVVINIVEDDHEPEEPSHVPQQRVSRRIRNLEPVVTDEVPVAPRGSRLARRLLNIKPIWLPNCNEKGLPQPGDADWSIAMGV